MTGSAITSAYEEQIIQGLIDDDPPQRVILPLLDQLVDLFSAPVKTGWWPFSLFSDHQPIQGLYLWGGVGRGKTWLLELFFEGVPIQQKKRLHFHRFMRDVHEQMAQMAQMAQVAHASDKNTKKVGQLDPLQQVARTMAKEIRLLFLDEFTVSDIGDAIILSGLLRALFEEGVTLVTTSNLAPDDLYQDGIQRASFLPAIALLNQKTVVCELGGEQDYRQQYLQQMRVFFTPADAVAEEALTAEFARLADEQPEFDGLLTVMTRPIPFRRRAGGVIWFDYEALCGPPRSQRDYIEVSRCHHSVIISGIPVLDATRDDSARRLLFLVDEFYDRRVKLIVSSDAPPERLYCGERLAFEFQRTASRLQEMQASDYLGLPHRG